jgi:hypothetical protein
MFQIEHIIKLCNFFIAFHRLEKRHEAKYRKNAQERNLTGGGSSSAIPLEERGISVWGRVTVTGTPSVCISGEFQAEAGSQPGSPTALPSARRTDSDAHTRTARDRTSPGGVLRLDGAGRGDDKQRPRALPRRVPGSGSSLLLPVWDPGANVQRLPTHRAQPHRVNKSNVHSRQSITPVPIPLPTPAPIPNPPRIRQPEPAFRSPHLGRLHPANSQAFRPFP